MHAPHTQHRRGKLPVASPEAQDVAIEFLTDQDLPDPEAASPRHQDTHALHAFPLHDSVAAHAAPAADMPVGFEEVDVASLAALLGQEPSTMCDIVFLDEDSPTMHAAGASPLPLAISSASSAAFKET